MKKRALLFLGFLTCFSVFGLSGQAYMSRFNAYRAWMKTWPLQSSNEFNEFIKEDLPLSNKLREKWLYECAKNKDWQQYLRYYQPSKDLNLQCYQPLALYNTGQPEHALASSLPIWLSGDTLPSSCNQLFENLLKMDHFSDQLITERLMLALAKRNIPLAFYLLKHYKSPRAKDIQALSGVYKNPINISKLGKSDLSDDFFLYGLKRLVSTNMDKAIRFWKSEVKLLNESQEQAFFSQVALYKAMRNHPDTLQWFSKIKPSFYNEVLVDWGIRFALKRRDWKRVAHLIQSSTNKDNLCWQYWLARSLEEQAKENEAKPIYETLAKNRNYYGFLASRHLNQVPSFENETASTNLLSLKPYQPIIDEIETLYKSRKSLEASRLLNDFISELPKEEASTLVYWLDSQLHWYGKSVYLSNETLNNQLSLRFPLAFMESIRYYSKRYGIKPEFVYAIIRQESGFREDVVSSAGARGLMQVMPKTAALVSKMGRIPYKDQSQLFLSQKNINIGIAYLQQLARRFNNHPILVAAAYNAGPSQVVNWLKNNPSKEIDIWIETLPWQETRNYLKNILAFYVVYQYRLNQKPDLKSFMAPL